MRHVSAIQNPTTTLVRYHTYHDQKTTSLRHKNTNKIALLGCLAV
jgi:hypothetical protein